MTFAAVEFPSLSAQHRCMLMWHADVGGLEVLPGQETTAAEAAKGEWTPVAPKPDCITINVGDALQYWSDDR